MAFELPAPGDIQGQIVQGEDLMQKLQGGDANALASAGIALVKDAGSVGAKIGGIVSTVSSAAASGAAVGAFAGSLAGLSSCGPYGAVLAGVIAAIVALENAFSGGYQGVKYVYPSEAGQGGPHGEGSPTATIVNRIANWPNPSLMGNQDSFGYPPGRLFADYLMAARPPTMTRRPALALGLMQEVAHEVLREGIDAANQITSGDIHAIVTSSNPLSQTGAILALPSVSPQVFMSRAGWGDGPGAGAQAVASAMLWHWLDWHNINPGHSSDDVSTQQFPFNLYAFNLDPSAAAAVGNPWPDAGVLMSMLRHSTKALGSHLSTKETLLRALQRAPDPLYFDADLYGAVPGWNYTLFYNVDLANALTTTCAMLSKGCSTRAIVSELMVQAVILRDENALGMGRGNTDNVSPGFRALLDDYLALAHEEEKDPHATMAKISAAHPMGFSTRAPSANPKPTHVSSSASSGSSSKPAPLSSDTVTELKSLIAQTKADLAPSGGFGAPTGTDRTRLLAELKNYEAALAAAMKDVKTKPQPKHTAPKHHPSASPKHHHPSTSTPQVVVHTSGLVQLDAHGRDAFGRQWTFDERGYPRRVG